MSLILKGIDIPEKENQMYMMELYADGHCSVAKIEDGECYELTIPSETEAIQIDLVRCRECIHRVEDSDFQSGHFCLKRRGNGGLFCEDDDFCSYGERRE